MAVRVLPGWLPLLLLGAVFVAHAPALQAGWVLDDHALVESHAAVRQGPAGIADAFASTAWKGEIEPGVWRPLPVVTWCLEAPLWRGEDGTLDAFGFHLTNLVLHGLCAVLLLLVLWRLLPNRPLVAAGAALVFAVHPMHVGTVSQVVGRADLLALLFCLIATGLWLRRRVSLLPLAVLAYFLALLSKETAVALPLVLMVVEAGRSKVGLFSARSGCGAVWLLFAFAFGVWMVPWPGPFASLLDTLGPAVEGLGRTALGLVAPVGFVRDRLAVTDGLLDLAPSALGWGVGGLVLVASVTVRYRFLTATALMFVLGALVAPAGAPLEARFAYVTAPALFLLAGRLVEALLKSTRSSDGRPRVLVAGALGVTVLVAALVGLSWREARAWKNDRVFLDALMERHPSEGSLYLRMARRIRLDIERERIVLARQVLTLEEQRDLARGSRLALDEAEALARAALRRAESEGADGQTAVPRAWRELGLIQLTGARAAEAVVSLREALRSDPRLLSSEATAQLSRLAAGRIAGTYEALARAEESVGNVREAAAHLESALQFAPYDIALMRRVGRSLIRAGRFGRGLLHLRRALDADLEADQVIEVEREFREAQQAAQDAAARHLRDGRRAEADGNAWDAVAAYERVLGADPTLLEAYGRLINLRGIYHGDCRRAYQLLAGARRVMDDTGVLSTDAWRTRFAELRRQLDEVCQEAGPPGGG